MIFFLKKNKKKSKKLNKQKKNETNQNKKHKKNSKLNKAQNVYVKNLKKTVFFFYILKNNHKELTQRPQKRATFSWRSKLV